LTFLNESDIYVIGSGCVRICPEFVSASSCIL
jgi:hypothetical protein